MGDDREHFSKQVDKVEYENCGNCYFFEKEEITCQRYAPFPLNIGAAARDEQYLLDRENGSNQFDNTFTVWPCVKTSDWCGEYKKRA